MVVLYSWLQIGYLHFWRSFGEFCRQHHPRRPTIRASCRSNNGYQQSCRRTRHSFVCTPFEHEIIYFYFTLKSTFLSSTHFPLSISSSHLQVLGLWSTFRERPSYLTPTAVMWFFSTQTY